MEYKKLSDICEIAAGGTPKRSEELFWENGEIPWLKISDIKSKYVSKSEEYITKKGLDNSSAKLFKKGTIIYTIFATVGEVAILNIDATTNQAIAGLTIKEPNKINSSYLFYFLKSIKQHIYALSRGVAQNNINLTVLRQINVPVPNLDIQEKIVNVLDQLQNSFDLKQKKSTKLDTLIKARFVEMFGSLKHNTKYKYKKISELTDVISGGTPNRKIESYWQNGTIPWIKTTELKNNRIFSADECITALGLEHSSAKIVPPHTILIAMYGQGKTRAMTAYLETSASTNQACACILPSSNIEPEYLWQYLILSYHDLRNRAKGGNQPNLNSRIIKNFEILVPPVSLQNEFADFVRQVDKSKFENIVYLNKTLSNKILSQIGDVIRD